MAFSQSLAAVSRCVAGRSFAVTCVTAALTLLALFFFSLAVPSAQAADDYLDPEVAFKFSARMADPKTAEVTYAIADGYYMYRDRFQFRAEGAKLGVPVMPQGKVKYDENFQKDVETYQRRITIRLPVEANGAFMLKVTAQGCADQGLCYPPMESQIRLSPAGGQGLLGMTKDALAGGSAGGAASAVAQSTPQAAQVASPSASADLEANDIEASLKSGKLLVILPLFLLLGLGLSFTPCVLPMVPILSAIIVGEGATLQRRRGFALSAAYSLGMAIVYTGLGIAAGLIGEGLSAALQTPWILGAVGGLMVLLALSMFDLYQLQLPAAVQLKLVQASQRQASGKLFGVFAMGVISTLIVGPCVAAPLAGTLVYISQTRDVVIGGSALFAMATGMSVPLLLVGVSAGALLPRAGLWMGAVKRFFGVLMLATALWMVSPVIPAWAQLAGWAAVGIGYGAYLLWGQPSHWVSRAVGLAFAVLGAVQLAGVATGGRDPLAPFAHLGARQPQATPFLRVKSVADLDATLARSSGKMVMLDFYADWCVSCKEMEKLTFSDPRVRARFANMVLLQADVTANDADDKAMLKRFNLFGPPGIIFFDLRGQEIRDGRVIGYQNADKFLRSLARVTGT